MAIQVLSMTRFNGGIGIGDKETITSVYNQNGLNSSWRFGTGVNVHDEPSKWSALPKSVNVFSGVYGTGTFSDEPRWFVDASPYAPSVFMYGSTGKVYQETAGVWTLIQTVPSSVGQGMCVFDNYLYCVSNTAVSQYGPLDSSPTWNHSWQTGLNDTSKLGFAPCLVANYGFYVGNGNQVSSWGNSTGSYVWTASAVSINAIRNVISMVQIEQYVAIGTVSSTSVFDNEKGYVYMWDGVSLTPNYYSPIDMGANNFVANYRNQLLSVNGIQGMIYLGNDPFVKVHQIPFLPISGSFQIYPGAVTTWKGGVYIGAAANSSDPNFVRGVYAWKAKVNSYPDALTCDYPISTGNTGNTVQVTATAGFGNNLYIGWRDGNAVGIDKVVASNAPVSGARINFMIFDDGRVPQQKSAMQLHVYHSPLQAGESVSIYYRTDRTDGIAPFATTPVVTHSYGIPQNPGDTADYHSNVTKWSPDTAHIPRFNELEIGVSVGCAATTPYVYAVSMMYDDLKEEERF